MKKEEYEKLLDKSNQYGEDFKGFHVMRFIALENSNFHTFMILVDYDGKEELVVVGLPIPRAMVLKSKDNTTINEHYSRSLKWEMDIAEQDLYWKPITDGNLRQPGVFGYIPFKTVEDEWVEEGNTIDDLVKKIKFQEQPVKKADMGMEM